MLLNEVLVSLTAADSTGVSSTKCMVAMPMSSNANAFTLIIGRWREGTLGIGR